MALVVGYGETAVILDGARVESVLEEGGVVVLGEGLAKMGMDQSEISGADRLD